MPPEFTQIIGGFHSEILGVHRVGTVTWLRGGEPLACDRYVNVYAVEGAKWQVKFMAPVCASSQVREWFDTHHGEIDSGFERMLDLLQSAFPDNHGRRIRILVLPPKTGFDQSWEYLAVNDRDLELTYALPLPDSRSPGEKSIAIVFPIIAHEFAHSYFWFHREKYRNNFSDEVVGYTMELCASYEALGRLPPEISGPAEIRAHAATLKSWEIFEQFHGSYPDTVTAPFVAANELAEREKEGRDVKGYCRAVPLGGRDFTKQDESVP